MKRTYTARIYVDRVTVADDYQEIKNALRGEHNGAEVVEDLGTFEASSDAYVDGAHYKWSTSIDQYLRKE